MKEFRDTEGNIRATVRIYGRPDLEETFSMEFSDEAVKNKGPFTGYTKIENGKIVKKGDKLPSSGAITIIDPDETPEKTK